MNKIAIIYEGVKSEMEIFDNLNKCFFSEKTEFSLFFLPADGNIYMLWERLKEDDFETDVISVVKEMCKTVKIDGLENIQASEFSEIYLFFDYDIHNNNLKKEHRGWDVLNEMFKTFNNETELGKLYVSYPMIESIKDISIENKDYKELYIEIKDSSVYKSLMGGSKDFSNYAQITRSMWLIACEASRKRATLIVTYGEDISYEDFLFVVTQEKIYETQRELYVKNNGCIAILNAIPLFLLEYFEKDFWIEVVSLGK